MGDVIFVDNIGRHIFKHESAATSRFDGLG
jgi:hypothetical protein